MRKCTRCHKGYWFHYHDACRLLDHMDEMESGADLVLMRGGIEITRYKAGTPEHEAMRKSMDPNLYLSFKPGQFPLLIEKVRRMAARR